MTQRNLADVIDQIIPLLPDNYYALKAYLREKQRWVAFCAPEAMWENWQEAHDLLARHLLAKAPAKGTWQHELFRIWSGRMDLP